jgi:hypothetical protein
MMRSVSADGLKIGLSVSSVSIFCMGIVRLRFGVVLWRGVT